MSYYFIGVSSPPSFSASAVQVKVKEYTGLPDKVDIVTDCSNLKSLNSDPCELMVSIKYSFRFAS
jgi:hypothetical protein